MSHPITSITLTSNDHLLDIIESVYSFYETTDTFHVKIPFMESPLSDTYYRAFQHLCKEVNTLYNLQNTTHRHTVHITEDIEHEQVTKEYLELRKRKIQTFVTGYSTKPIRDESSSRHISLLHVARIKPFVPTEPRTLPFKEELLQRINT